jgi:diaminopropionate ammonia-lyase
MCQYAFNPFLEERPDWARISPNNFGDRDIADFHRALDCYRPTPLVSLPGLAARLGVGSIVVKDESQRFDLKAFKAMGASYAIYGFLKKEAERKAGREMTIREFFEAAARRHLGKYTFCTATDGNHGRGVAWTARKFGQQAVIYVPRGTVPARLASIRREGAEVVVVDGNYDDAVRRAETDARRNGWQVVSDTSYAGNVEIPSWIMAGYTTIFREIDEVQEGPGRREFDFVFVQSGVGALAAAAVWHYHHGRSPRRPVLVNVEPTQADCLLESVRSGKGEIRTARGDVSSIMAGLNCGTPSLLAWEYVKRGMDLFVSISDEYAALAMRRYYYAEPGDPRIISGESGAAGLGGLLALLSDEKLAAARERMRLGAESAILLLNTEGDTDPDNFARIVAPRA